MKKTPNKICKKMSKNSWWLVLKNSFISHYSETNYTLYKIICIKRCSIYVCLFNLSKYQKKQVGLVLVLFGEAPQSAIEFRVALPRLIIIQFDEEDPSVFHVEEVFVIQSLQFVRWMVKCSVSRCTGLVSHKFAVFILRRLYWTFGILRDRLNHVVSKRNKEFIW